MVATVPVPRLGWPVLVGVSLLLGAGLAAGHAGLVFALFGAAGLILLAALEPRLALIAWLFAFALIPGWIGPTQVSIVTLGTLLAIGSVALLKYGGGTLGMPAGFSAPWAFFCGGLLLSLAAYHAQGNAFAAVELAVFCPLALALGHSLDQRERATLLRWIVNVGCLVAGVAIWTAISKHSPYDMLGLGPPGSLSAPFRGHYLRVALAFGTPLGLGSFLALCFAVALWQRRYLPAVLLGAGIATTVSRGPILAALFALAAFALADRRLSRRRVLAVVGVLAVLLVIPGGLASYLAHSSPRATRRRRGSTPTRSSACRLRNSGPRDPRQPIAGHGLGTVSSGGFTGLQANAKTYSDVTNEYITIGLEAGAIALLGLLAVLARLGWRLRSDRALPVLAAQVVGWLTVSLVASLPLFFLIAGCALGARATRTAA